MAGSFACQNSVDEKEFTDCYQKLSDRRIRFRMNMKALGDSTKRQRKFVSKAVSEALSDTTFEKQISLSHALWSDSIRNRLIQGQSYFETQFTSNRPLIGSWEKKEMQLDRMAQRIKEGELSESLGLDSMKIMLGLLDSLIIRTDTLLLISNRHYWAFRRDLDEYRFNALNLKALYQPKKEK
jgi:hypothetical protein